MWFISRGLLLPVLLLAALSTTTVRCKEVNVTVTIIHVNDWRATFLPAEPGCGPPPPPTTTAAPPTTTPAQPTTTTPTTTTTTTTTAPPTPKSRRRRRAAASTADPTTCIGGLSRLSQTVRDLQKKNVPNLVLNAGNSFHFPSPWLSAMDLPNDTGTVIVNATEAVAQANKLMGVQVTALGSWDFDLGLRSTNMFIEALREGDVSVVGSNVNCTVTTDYGDLEKDFCNSEEYNKPYVIYNLNVSEGVDIAVGIVGFTSKVKVNHQSDPGLLEFEDEVKSLTKVVEEMLNKTDMIIALGDGNYELASTIAKEVKNLNAVIYGGGASNKSYENVTSFYDHQPVMLATTTMDATVVGELRATFTITDGKEKKFIGMDGIPHAANATSDPDVDNLLWQWETQVNATLEVPVDGYLYSNLEGSTSACCYDQCTLGNALADAALESARITLGSNEELIHMAFWHCGAISGTNITHGPLTHGQVLNALPYPNNVVVVWNVSGQVVKKLLENGASHLENQGKNESRNDTDFLQVSGNIRVVIDRKGQAGQRIKSFQVPSTDNGAGVWLNVTDEERFNIAVPSFMAHGRFTFTELKGFASQDLGMTEETALINYIERLGKLLVVKDERMVDWQAPPSPEPPSPPSPYSCNKQTGLTIFLTLLVTAFIVGVGMFIYRYIIPRYRSHRGSTVALIH